MSGRTTPGVMVQGQLPTGVKIREGGVIIVHLSQKIAGSMIAVPRLVITCLDASGEAILLCLHIVK